MMWRLSGLLLLVMLCTAADAGLATTEGYAGTIFHAHIKRTGGKLVPDEFAATGSRRDDYDPVEVTAKTQRIPAVHGQGLQLLAVLYNMPLDASVDVQVLRPVSDQG